MEKLTIIWGTIKRGKIGKEGGFFRTKIGKKEARVVLKKREFHLSFISESLLSPIVGSL